MKRADVQLSLLSAFLEAPLAAQGPLTRGRDGGLVQGGIDETRAEEDAVKKTTKKTKSLKVKSGVKGGRISLNHAKSGLKVKSGLKGGRIALNHAKAGLKVKSRVKGGKLAGNHSRVRL